jgi:di/tricarboxylate transporter
MFEPSFFLVSAVVLGLFAVFLTERLRPDVAVLLAVSILLAAGQVTPKEVLSVFSNAAPLTIACLFIISAALERTGVVNKLGDWLSRHAGSEPRKVLVVMMVVAYFVSAPINNTPIVMILTPVAIMLARSRNMAPSKLLIPLSYATILGGTLTLMGTSTNLLVSGMAQQMGQPPIGIFEMTPAAIGLGVICLAFLALFAPRWMPDRGTLSDRFATPSHRTYMAELFVPEQSAMVGRTLADAGLAGGNNGVQAVKIFRNDIQITEPAGDTLINTGDRLVIHTGMAGLLGLRGSGVVATAHGDSRDFETIKRSDADVMEVIVGRTSRYCHRPMRDLDITARYGIHVIAIHRQDANIQGNLDDFRLEPGDLMLIEGTPQQIRRFAENGELITLGPVKTQVFQPARAWIASLTAVGIMALAALNVMPIEGLAIIGALIVVITGCLHMDDGYKSIEWPILVLIYGMLAVSIAMEKAGVVALFGDVAKSVGTDVPPWMILSFIALVSSVMTEFVSNNAVAVMMTPIAISVAQALGLDPMPFIMAVMFCASASFATPIGYQTNTFVYTAGGYKFTDFARLGVPLNIIVWLYCTLVIPLFWPLQ